MVLIIWICTEFGLGDKELWKTKISWHGHFLFLTINFDLVNCSFGYVRILGLVLGIEYKQNYSLKTVHFHTALNPSLTRFLPWPPFFLFHIENFSSFSFWRTISLTLEMDTSYPHTAPISYCKTSSIFHLFLSHDSGIIICKVWKFEVNIEMDDFRPHLPEQG